MKFNIFVLLVALILSAAAMRHMYGEHESGHSDNGHQEHACPKGGKVYSQRWHIEISNQMRGLSPAS